MIYEGDLESEGLWAAKSLGICSPDERKEICFQSVCRQNLEMNGHFGKAG